MFIISSLQRRTVDKTDRVKESNIARGWNTASEAGVANVAFNKPVFTEQP